MIYSMAIYHTLHSARSHTLHIVLVLSFYDAWKIEASRGETDNPQDPMLAVVHCGEAREESARQCFSVSPPRRYGSTYDFCACFVSCWP
jgi:hypothetical protein